MMRSKRFKTQRQSGFTLIELLVAIGIMILIMGITLPMLGALGRSTGLANTSNEISASLIAGRAVAMKEGKDAAVIFRGTGENNEGPVQVIIAVRNADLAVAGFKPYENRGPTTMAANCRVAGIASLGASPDWIRPDSILPVPAAVKTKTWIGVCFGPDGRIKNLDSTLIDPPKDYVAPTKVYYDADSNDSETPASGSDYDQKISFLPILAIYDARTLRDGIDNEVSPTGLKQFINQEITLLSDSASSRIRLFYFDSYTGQLVR